MFLILLLLAYSFAIKALNRHPLVALEDVSSSNTNSTAVKTSGFNTCQLCWDFFSCCIDDVINVILNGGGNTCAAVCGELQSSIYQTVCTGLCDIVGFAAFAVLLKQSDTYPIHLCVDLLSCAPNNCKSKCGAMTLLSVLPQSAQVGNPLTVSVAFKALAPIGTGEVYFNVAGPSVFGSPRIIDQHVLIEDGMPAAGVYNWTFAVPTSGYVIPCPAGLYSGNVSICAGDCQDTVAGLVLDSRPIKFQLT